ncbi:hypothetical protein Glove_94g44 [Diversispora epigaea]|uniref:Transposase putative helix-turn-helix domain-containing protein n=1 Tax=Diversispora epigaea TaxID=1348612 RepID=A0A397JEL0_9GLOM|nr:hypothetical protein Glove_94g44 [Diversispora epigaea]
MVLSTDVSAKNNEAGKDLWQDIMECIVEKGEKLPKPKSIKNSKKIKSSKITVDKAQRIRLFPTQEERLKLKCWIETARWTYNHCLVAVEKESIEKKKEKSVGTMSQC